MKSKIIISLLVVMCMMLTSFAALAAPNVSTSVAGNYIQVTISGTISSGNANEPVNLYVTKPSGATGNPQTDLAHIDQRLTGPGGTYSFTFTVNPEIGGGICHFYINTKNGIVETGTFAVVDIGMKLAVIDSVNHAASTDDVRLALEGKELGLNLDIYNAIDKTFLYGQLFAQVSGGTPFAGISDFDARIKELTVLSALNQGISGIVKDGKLAYLETIGITGETYTSYLTKLAPVGIGNVNRHMQNENLTDSAKAGTQFDKLVYTNMISNYYTVGIGHVDAIIRDHGELLGLNVAKYLACSDKESVCRALVNSKAEEPGDLLDPFNNAIAAATPTKPETPSGGGGGGGGGGGSYVPPTVPGEPDDKIVPVDKTAGFKDLGGYDWALDAIFTLKNAGVISGKAEGVFAPGDNVTREEFLAMLVKALGFTDPGTKEPQFADVKQGDWYYPAVKTAVGMGIVNGTSGDAFGVGEQITRQDMVTMAFRALRMTSVTLDTDIASVSFADQSEIAGYAVNPVKVFKKMKLVSGYPDDTFKPLNKTVRAEAAQLIYNLLTLKGGAK